MKVQLNYFPKYVQHKRDVSTHSRSFQRKSWGFIAVCSVIRNMHYHHDNSSLFQGILVDFYFISLLFRFYYVVLYLSLRICVPICSIVYYINCFFFIVCRLLFMVYCLLFVINRLTFHVRF